MYFSALANNGTQMAVASLDVTQIGHWEHFLGSVFSMACYQSL